MSGHYKTGDAWKTIASIYGKISGTWTFFTKGYRKTDGSWEQIYAGGNVSENLIVFSEDALTGAVLCDGTNSTPDLLGYYLKAKTSGSPSAATGSNTHSHDSQTFQLSTNDNLTNAYGNLKKAYEDGGATIFKHYHKNTHGHGSTNHEPEYVELRPYTGLAAVPVGGVLFTDGVIPSGFKAYDETAKYIKCGTSGGTTGGGGTHTHSYSGSTDCGTGLVGAFSGESLDDPDHQLRIKTGNDDLARKNGDASLAEHYHVADHSHEEDNEPPYYTLKAIEATSAIYQIPSGVIGFFKDGTVPDGWSVFSAASGKFIKIDSTADTTGGSSTHTHSHSGDVGDWTAPYLAQIYNTGSANYCRETHAHSWPADNHSSETLIPLHKEVLLCKKD